MACGCASRMRGILRMSGYKLDKQGITWSKEGHPDFPDARVEEEHFKVLIENLSDSLFSTRAALFMKKLGGISG